MELLGLVCDKGDLFSCAIGSASLYGYAGIVLSLWSLALRNDRTLILLSAMSGVCWGMNGYLLGSDAALATQLVSSVAVASRLFTSALIYKKAVVGAMAAVVAVGVASWEGIGSMPVIIATCLLLAGTGLSSGMRMRLLLAMATSFYLLHAYIYGSNEQMVACILAYLSLGYGYQSIRKNARIQGKFIANQAEVGSR